MTLRSPRFSENERVQRASENKPAMGYGEKGEAVRILQQALIDLGLAMPISTVKFGSPDGIYGNETVTKVREFQNRHRLQVDGIAGRNTWAKLDGLLPGPAAPLPQLPPLGMNRKVRLHFRSIATPVVPEFVALDNAQRVYRQYGIDIEFASGQSLLLDPTQALELNAVDGTCQWDQVSDEQRLLHSLGGRQGVGPNDILVYFVNTLRELDGGTLAGCAGHAPGRPAVAVAAVGSPWTLAHEVGHVLLSSSFSPVHSNDPSNLMFSPTANINANPPGLDGAQLTAIRNSPFCVRI